MQSSDPFALSARLQTRHDEQRYRTHRVSASAQGREMQVDGRLLKVFCSNDYLGLAGHPAVSDALAQGAKRFGVGSGASHLVCGHHEAHQALEEALARITGRERALVFSSGYMANAGVIGALLDKNTQVLEDRLNHASLLDAGLASGARFRRYQHNNADDLARHLQRSADLPTLVVTDGVFSMDGDCAPLNELARVSREHQAWLMVDDAHGFGVLGQTGAGLLEQEGIEPSAVPVLMATLGKAIGTSGAFVAGSHELIEALIQFARPYIYTTAMPPALAYATSQALVTMQEEAWRRTHLRRLIQLFRSGCADYRLPVMASTTAIQPLLVGSEEAAMRLSAALWEAGFWVTAIRPPTVAAGTSRLRVTLSAAHTEDDIAQLLNVLHRLWPAALRAGTEAPSQQTAEERQ